MKVIWYIPVLAAFVACGTHKKKEQTEVVSKVLWNELESRPDTLATGDVLTYRPVYQASETIFNDLVHTKLEVSFDWNKAWLYGRETLTAKPHFYATDSLILDAKGMEIKAVSLSGQNLKYTYDGEYLRIKLDRIYQRTEKYTLVIDYVAKPEERATNGSAAITSDKGLYFINPRGEDAKVMPQIWTQGETEASSVWFPTIDAPNMKTTQEILITVDNKYTTLSNGKMLASKQNTDGTRTDHWKQDLPHAPYLFMMGVGEFKIVKDSYTRANGETMEVNYYVEPAWEAHAKAIFGETPAMIAFFSKLTGVEYPWDKYSQIVVRDYVSGAMENTGAVVFGDYAYKTERELLDEDDNSTIAHELFHHWFGDLVTCESWSNLPLNESFANYSQYLWDEHRYGLDQADYMAEQEKEGYYASAANGGAHNLIWFDYSDKEDMFDGHSYNKGGRILHMLRSYLGDEAFFEGLKLYLKTHQFKPAEFHELRQAFEEVSGEDLNWFFNQWFLAANHPDIEIEQHYSEAKSELVLTIYQNQDLAIAPLYKIPVQIMVYDEAGEHLHKVVIDKLENQFMFPVKGKLNNVLFDYQQSMLGTVQENKPSAQYVHQYYNGKRYIARRNALLHGTKKATPETDRMVLDALNDSFWAIRLQALENASALNEQAKAEAKSKVLMLAKTDPNSYVRANAVAYLADQLGKMELEALCTELISNHKSYTVIGAALNELAKANSKLAAEVASDLEKEPSSKMKSSIAQLYASESGPEKLAFFEKLANDGDLGGYEAIICLNSTTLYLSKQGMSVVNKAPELYRNLYQNGGTYVKMFMPQNVRYLINNVDTRKKEIEKQLNALGKNSETEQGRALQQEQQSCEELLSKLTNFVDKIEAERK